MPEVQDGVLGQKKTKKQIRHDCYIKHREKRRAYGAEWRKNNPEKIKGYQRRWNAWTSLHRKTKFKIPTEQWTKMCMEQDGRCYICDVTCEKFNLDHDHATGKIRKLLCSRCNLFLGFMEGTPGIVEKMKAYIEQHKEKPT